MRSQTKPSTPDTVRATSSVRIVASSPSVEKITRITCSNKETVNKKTRKQEDATGNFNFVGIAG